MPLGSTSDSRHRPGETSMMINANSMAQLRVHFPQHGQTDPGQIKRGCLTQNGDLRTGLPEGHNYYHLRHDDLFDMKSTLQDGNLSGVKPAPNLPGKIHRDIHGDLKNMCATNQAPSPIDVTA
jgi:hypothetical protein